MQYVDILLATYNGSLYVDQLLESISNQTYTNWRLIVRDDGSCDDTVSKIERFSKKNKDKVLVINKGGNLGAAQNFSELMAKSTAEFAFFADQDDVWHPDKILKTINFALSIENIDKSPVLVHTDLAVVDEHLKTISGSFWSYQGLRPEQGGVFKDIMIQNVVTGCTMMANKKLLDLAIPIPANARMHDWWLALVACAMGEVYFMPAQTILYRQHSRNDVGARRYSFSAAIGKLNNISGIRNSISLTQAQARSFHDRYLGLLSEENAYILAGFLEMEHDSFLKRRLKSAKLRLRKHGFLRTFGFYLFM